MDPLNNVSWIHSSMCKGTQFILHYILFIIYVLQVLQCDLQELCIFKKE